MAKTFAATGAWRVVIVKRSDVHRFVILPKRWIVERTLAWISRTQQLARDFERYATTVAVFVRLAMIRIMLKLSVVRQFETDQAFREERRWLLGVRV